VAQHIRAPAYARELGHARQVYRTRRDLLLELLQRELATLGCRWTVPAGGFSLLVSLPPGCGEMAVAEEAAWQGVMVLSGRCFAPIPTARWRCTIRLTYGDLPADQLRDGIQRLARATRLSAERRSGPMQDLGMLV
jgi:2-aminoadipate transaminase